MGNEQTILPCPFCGGECVVRPSPLGKHCQKYVLCLSGIFAYHSGSYDTASDAIVAHNNVARAVMEKNNG